MLKASNYNLIIDRKENIETLIFNTLYGSLAVFNQDEFKQVQEILNSPEACNNSDFTKILQEQKFLVPDSIDEFAIIENRKRLGIKDENRIDIIIMPTLECNFSCVYCYESVKKGSMSVSTVESIKKWMTREIPKYKLVMLSWFGGEPLLNLDSIISITEHANKIAAAKNILLVRHITTNGYNLSKSTIEKLIKLGIADYQITVDGTPETHNKLRPLRNGKPTFDRIFRNITWLLKADEKVKITLRINFNHINLHQIPGLLNMFPEMYRNQIRISFEPIFGSCELSATDNIREDVISASLASYYGLAEELGYDSILGRSHIETGKLVYCYAERENQYDINYNGDIFKCSVNDFNKEGRVGYIDENGDFIKDTDNFNSWMNIPIFDALCKSCQYVPLCMGGCRKTRINRKSTGSFCSLVPTNASYVLKQIAYKGFPDLVLKTSLPFK